MSAALVTGATVGIGNAYADLLASKGCDLVIVSRNQHKLEEVATFLRERYEVEVEIIVADLTTENGITSVEARLLDSNRPIDVLINNAGFGLNKAFTKSQVSDELSMLKILVEVPMRLAHAVLPGMKEHNSGTIVNVSSVAGFIAGGSYSAAKSYLTVLSESLHSELAGTEVKVSALCPGFTRTEFHQRGGMRMEKIPHFMWLDAKKLVEQSWADARAGEAVSIPGRQYQFLVLLVKFLPRGWVRSRGMRLRKNQRR